MRLTVSHGKVPPGRYLAKLTGIEDSVHEEFGPGLRFEFTIITGPFLGRKVGRTTGCSPSPSNVLGKLLSHLLDRPLRPDEEIDVDPLVGRDFSIEVAATKSGSRVESASIPPSA